MTPQIGLLGALFGGLLTLVSPCSALLLPAFFAVAFDRVSTLLLRTTVFYLGLAAVLVPLGAGVGAVGSLLTRHRDALTRTGGIVLVVLGLLIVTGRGFRLSVAATWMSRLRFGSTLSILALGAVYGLAGFCAGPLLGGVLTVSMAGGSAAYGGLLMGVYALGMAVPLFLMALVWDRLRLGDRRWIRGRPITIGPLRTHTTSLVSGLLFAGIGVLFLTTDGTATIGGLTGVDTQYNLQAWFLDSAARAGDATVLLAIAVVVLVLLLVRILLISRRSTRSERSRDVGDQTVGPAAPLPGSRHDRQANLGGVQPVRDAVTAPAGSGAIPAPIAPPADARIPTTGTHHPAPKGQA